ncbi:MAG TPA: A24 family peptidase [Buttiauxella sp.]|jgi:leader peptidase (prepilin peptidase)/N-methyltransferase
MYLSIFFVLGLCIGSFSNVIIYRLPIILFKSDTSGTFNLFLPRSHCPGCLHPLGTLQLIPLVSWVCQLGNCRHCKKNISAVYPSVELLNALMYMAIAVLVREPLTAMPLCLFGSALIILAAIDYRHMILPDVITLPLLWAGLLWNSTGFGLVDTQQALWGAAMGYVSLWATYWLYLLSRKREGLGYGDFKISAALGAWLGADSIAFIVFIGSILGVCIWGGRRTANRHAGIPFGPALCVAAMMYSGYQLLARAPMISVLMPENLLPQFYFWLLSVRSVC